MTSKTATAARDVLKLHIDADDEHLVVDVTADARAWPGFNTRASKWLKESFQ